MVNKKGENKMKNQEMKMQEMFKRTFVTFLQRVAEVNNVKLEDLISLSNKDDEVRKDLEARFLAAVKVNNEVQS